MPAVPESLRLAFEVIRPKPASEPPPPQRFRRRGRLAEAASADHLPGRRVTVQGRGRSVRCGASICKRPSFGNTRAGSKAAGVPLQAEALKRITQESLDQLELMETQSFGDLLPADFTDGGGNLVDTVFLDVLDHLIAQCRQRGIYVYLTLVNDMNAYYRRDSFMVGQNSAPRCSSTSLLWPHMEHYIQGLLNHRNRYTGTAYRDEPAIAVFEVINEPEYLDYAEVVGDGHNSLLIARRWTQWCAVRGIHRVSRDLFPRVPLRTGPPGGGSPGKGHS